MSTNCLPPLPSLQVLQLPGLQQLGLESCSYTADSTAQLWLLGSSLTRLEVFGFDNPDPLPALTQLRHLSLQDCDPPEQHGGWLDTALEQLQQLTCLVSAAGGLAAACLAAGRMGIRIAMGAAVLP